MSRRHRGERPWKRYVIGNSQGGYSRLTEDIADAASRILRRRPGDRVEASARESVGAEGRLPGDRRGRGRRAWSGRNGAGKTTLLKIMAQITDPTEGRAVVTGRVGSLLEVGTGFHPELTGRENVFLNGAILGMRKR